MRLVEEVKRHRCLIEVYLASFGQGWRRTVLMVPVELLKLKPLFLDVRSIDTDPGVGKDALEHIEGHRRPPRKSGGERVFRED